MFNKLLLSLPIALLAATTSYAETIKAEIPFEFTVGQKVLPAGTYSFDTSVQQGLLCVRSEDWKNTAIVLTNNADGSNRSSAVKIVFNRYGESYFLSKVVYEGGDARLLRKSHQEAEMLARGPAKKEVLLASK